MIGLALGVALLAQQPAATAQADVTPAIEARWQRCIRNEAQVTPPATRIAGCDALLATPGLNPRLTALGYYWRAVAKGDALDPAGMRADLDRGITVLNSPALERATLLTARAYLSWVQKRPADARADYDRALTISPGQADALYGRAELAAMEKRYADARADLTAADSSSLSPAFHAKLHVLRGAVLVELNEPALAAQDYDRAVQVGPQEADAYYSRGFFAASQKRFDAALPDYVKATELAPRSAAAFNSLCWLLAADLKREFDRARTACDTAVGLAPNDAAIQDSAGLVALQQRRWQDAWNHYNAAVVATPGRAGYRYGRGLAAIRLGRAIPGNADIAAAIKLDPQVASEYAGYGQTP